MTQQPVSLERLSDLVKKDQLPEAFRLGLLRNRMVEVAGFALGTIQPGANQDVNIQLPSGVTAILIDMIWVVASVDTNFDLELWVRNDRIAYDSIYLNTVNTRRIIDSFLKPLYYVNLDRTNQIHGRVSIAGAGTAAGFQGRLYFIRQLEARG